MAVKSDGGGEAPEEQCSEAQADLKEVSEKAPHGWKVPAPSWSEDSVLLGNERHKLKESEQRTLVKMEAMPLNWEWGPYWGTELDSNGQMTTWKPSDKSE